jgi:hypothetical protein
MKLYKYYENYGRMGAIEGLFFLTDEEVEKYKEYTDYLYWDELLGKHSEGYFNFSDKTLEAIELPTDVVATLHEKLGKVLSGPFDFEYFDEIIQERIDEDEEEDADED